jgi:hypothetical protein
MPIPFRRRAAFSSKPKKEPCAAKKRSQGSERSRSKLAW